VIRRGLLALLCLAPFCVFAALDEKALSEAIALRNQGEFDKASRSLELLIEQSSGTLEAAEKRTLEFEIERIRRIRQDYTLTREKLLEQLQQRLRDFTEEELETHERAGLLDAQVIDGQKFYVGSSASNLVLRVPDLRLRLKKRKPDTMYRRLYNQMLHVREAAKLTSSPLLLPQDYMVTYTLTVDANAVENGKVLRAWLPFVRNFPHHSDIYLLRSEPGNPIISPPESPHRTIYMERAAQQDHATTFSATFTFRTWARNFSVDSTAVQPYNKEAPEYQYYSAERKPHIDFSVEELKRISTEAVAGETNAYLQAKKLYDWVGRNTVYQYAREYSTIENLSQYTLSRRAGDCGQHGMLFLALCRISGIPARWTTGWEMFNDRGRNMHDWCEFYVEPYGWLPADPDMAVNILNHADDELTTDQQTALADWLFGNMDNYRMTTNADFGAPLFPPKQDFRSETVDFQRGEVECEGRNLYFDKWNYSMRVQPITAEVAQEIAAQFSPAEPPMVLPVNDWREGATTTTVTAAPPEPKPSPLAVLDSATSETSITIAIDSTTTSPTEAKAGPSAEPDQPGTSMTVAK